MPLEKTAGAILYHPKKGIVLILRDKKSILFPNMWTMPGGHVEKGETPLKTVKREVWEELGYKIKNPELFHIGKPFNAIQHTFISRINKSINKLELNEGQKMAFIPFNKIDKVKIGFGLKKVIKSFIKKYISNKPRSKKINL